MLKRTFLRASVAGVVVPAVAGCTTMKPSVPNFSSRYADLTATQAVTAIRQGDISAEQYAGALIARCQSLRSLNALSWFEPEQVLASSRAVDQARRLGQRPGMLSGLPLLVKDNIDTAGFPSTAATPGLRRNLPTSDAPVMQALFRHGAFLLAKANMAELALSGTSSESIFGPVRNPYDPRRFAGGSSGGTAAGIAARLAPAGLGTDTAGSGRIPAAFCGIAGFRPSTQPTRPYPTRGIVPLATLLDTPAPMGRTVEDIALLHAAMSGRPLAKARGLAGRRLGISRRFLWDDLEPEVERVMLDALAKMREAGVTFVEVDLGEIPEASWSLQRNMMLVGMKQDLGLYLRSAGSSIDPIQVLASVESPAIASLFKSVATMPMTDAQARTLVEVQAPSLRLRYEAAVRAYGVEAIVFPSEPITAQVIKAANDLSPWIVNGKPISSQMLSRNTRMAAALGLPALVLPAGLTREGLPVSLEINGLPGDDDGVLGIGQTIEKVVGTIPGPSL